MMPELPRRKVCYTGNNLRARLNLPPLQIVPNHNNFPNVDNLRARLNSPPHTNGPAYMASLKKFRWDQEQEKSLKEQQELMSEGYCIDHDGKVVVSSLQNHVHQQQPVLMNATVVEQID